MPILDARFLDRPTDWDAVFGRFAPLILEIGFGRGDNLIDLARRHPEANLIGLEISRTSLRKAADKVRNQRATHVRVVDGAAAFFLHVNVPPLALSRLVINFPDPWYKPDHHQRRLLTPEFLHLAATRMQPGALLEVATDHPDYQPVVTECLVTSPWFDSRLPTPYTTDPGDRFRTKYELKALDEGRVSFYYHYQRNRTATTAPFAIPEELPVPHAIVSLPLSLDAIAERFEPFRFSAETETDPLHVRFLTLYRRQDAPALMVEAYLSQEPQHQHIGFSLVDRGDNAVIVRLHEIGFPRATRGVHLAVGRLAAWLVSLHPDAHIVTHNLAAPPVADRSADHPA